MFKICSKCKIEKDESEFHKDKSNKDGLCYKCKECFKKHYNNKREYILKREKEYRKNNKEKRKQYQHQYHEINKEKVNKKHREYDHRTREQRREIKRQWRNEKYCKDINFRLRVNLSDKIRITLLKNRSSKKGFSILKFLPYSIQQLKQHLESLWEPWMNWENYGTANINKKTWQIDHIIPCAKLQFNSFEHPSFLKCWSLENLRPLESMENIKKGDK